MNYWAEMTIPLSTQLAFARKVHAAYWREPNRAIDTITAGEIVKTLEKLLMLEEASGEIKQVTLSQSNESAA